MFLINDKIRLIIIEYNYDKNKVIILLFFIFNLHCLILRKYLFNLFI
jgi:hypothetical protein